VAALLDYLQIERADLIGYSMGGGVAMQCAIRHPEKVRRAVIISGAFRLDGLVKEALDAFQLLTRIEGIIPALESAHGLAQVIKLAPTMGKDETIVLCLSGRGDKDVESVGRYLGMNE